MTGWERGTENAVVTHREGLEYGSPRKQGAVSVENVWEQQGTEPELTIKWLLHY